MGTKFLKSTGIFDAYEHVISSMVSNGWPSDKSIFEHAAYEVLKWASEHKDQYRGLVGRSIDKKADLIFASRDNIPELDQYRHQQELERHKIEMDSGIKEIGGIQKIQLKSKRSYNLTQNKLDLSIFQCKDRSLLKKHNVIPAGQESTKFELKVTKPKKIGLQKVQDTSFNLHSKDYLDSTLGAPDEQQQQQQYEHEDQDLFDRNTVTQKTIPQDESFQRDEDQISQKSYLLHDRDEGIVPDQMNKSQESIGKISQSSQGRISQGSQGKRSHKK